MIITVIGLSLMAMLVLVAVTAVNGDSHLTARDLQQKQAYEAAKAGIDNYAYHLHANNSYWTSCANVTTPAEPKTAVNLQGSTTNRLPVPGSTGAEFAIELLPATEQTNYTQCDTAHPTESMLQAGNTLKGTFRIRSTGFDRGAEAKLVATFKPASFLDYVYFTQYETSDPVTYGKELEAAATTQCEKTIAEKRYEKEIASGKGKCDVISFKSEDEINGPMHTNDAFAICGTPSLGRDAADPVEVSASAPGWFQTKELTGNSKDCSGSNKNFKGTFTAKAPILKPPPTNGELDSIAEEHFHFKGQVRICLEGASMVVMTYNLENSCSSPPNPPLYKGPIPANGVVYVKNGICSTAYEPKLVFYAVTDETKECGDAFIQGTNETYSGQLTVAAENNIVITGNLCMESCSSKPPLKGEGVLGLIANNFVRIYHPVNFVHPKKCTKNFEQGHWVEKCEEELTKWECAGNSESALKGVIIDAAILAIKHSFIVDNYTCGAVLGKLTVIGAIAQKYRGAVGTTSGTGYTKDYNYDDRLKYIEPPSFIEPEKSAWVIGRETLE